MKIAVLASYVRKSLVALAGAEIAWATVSLRHGFSGVSFDEWIAQATLVATAAGVYVAPNEPRPVPEPAAPEPVAPATKPART